MIRVISSPSISTTGCATLILDAIVLCVLCFCFSKKRSVHKEKNLFTRKNTGNKNVSTQKIFCKEKNWIDQILDNLVKNL